MITMEQYLMGRADGMTEVLWSNARNTVMMINWLEAQYRIDHPDAPAWLLSSGRRTPEINAGIPGAAVRSNHLTCNAADIVDRSRALCRWAFANLHHLADRDLYMEDPRCTPTWMHVQVVPPLSRNRVFIPNADWAQRLGGKPLTLGSIR
jgi:hypothetical protein